MLSVITYPEYGMMSACISRVLVSAKEALCHAEEDDFLAHNDNKPGRTNGIRG
jgi:hypothetical protein